MIQSKVAMKGDLLWKVVKGNRKASLAWKLRNTLTYSFIKGWFAANIVAPLASVFGVATIMGQLQLVHVGRDGIHTDYGVVGNRVVTTAYCAYMVDIHQTDATTVGDFKWHASGTSTTNEASAETDLGGTDGITRNSGTQVEGSAVAYQSVATLAYGATLAITEHGLFNTAGSATMMDRTKFAAVNVVSGDSIQFTYTITYTAGS